MSERKEDDDAIVKLNSTPPEDDGGAATRVGEDAYRMLARGMLSSPEPVREPLPPPSVGLPRPPQNGPPRASSAPSSQALLGLPKLHDPELDGDAHDAGTMLMPQAAQFQIAGRNSQAPPRNEPALEPALAVGPKAFPFPPPPPLAPEPASRPAIRTDIVIAAGTFLLVLVIALLYLYFREIAKH